MYFNSISSCDTAVLRTNLLFKIKGYKELYLNGFIDRFKMTDHIDKLSYFIYLIDIGKITNVHKGVLFDEKA